MTLENLSRIGRLKPHKTTPTEIQRLLSAAEASLQDARREQNSAGSRFDLAYKSLMQSALIALLANGYRPATSEPGHQQTTLQTLPKTLGLTSERLRLFEESGAPAMQVITRAYRLNNGKSPSVSRQPAVS